MSIYQAKLHATMAFFGGLCVAFVLYSIFRVNDNLLNTEVEDRDWLYDVVAVSRVALIGLCLIIAVIGFAGMFNIARIERRRRAKINFRRHGFTVVKAG